MRFPADLLRTKPSLGVLSATALTAACLSFGTATASADDPPPPPLRQIHYTVWAEEPFTAEIYYRDTDPPNWAEYSHNPYLFSPNIEVPTSVRTSNGTSTSVWPTPISGRWLSRAPVASHRRNPTSTVRLPSTAWS